MVSQEQFDELRARIVNQEQFEELRLKLVAYESQQSANQTGMQQEVKNQVGEVSEGLKELYTVANSAVGAVAVKSAEDRRGIDCTGREEEQQARRRRQDAGTEEFAALQEHEGASS